MTTAFLPFLLIAAIGPVFSAESPAPAPATTPADATKGMQSTPTPQSGAAGQATDRMPTTGSTDSDRMNKDPAAKGQSDKRATPPMNKTPGSPSPNDGLTVPVTPLTGQQTPMGPGDEKTPSIGPGDKTAAGSQTGTGQGQAPAHNNPGPSQSTDKFKEGRVSRTSRMHGMNTIDPMNGQQVTDNQMWVYGLMPDASTNTTTGPGDSAREPMYLSFSSEQSLMEFERADKSTHQRYIDAARNNRQMNKTATGDQPKQ